MNNYDFNIYIQDELTLDSVKNHKKVMTLPLTLREKEMKELNRSEVLKFNLYFNLYILKLINSNI